MTIYIELLIIDNFALDLLVGYIVLVFLKADIKPLRLIISASIGTALAVVLPYIPNYLAILYKITVLIVCVIPLRLYRTKKEFFATLIIYVLTSTMLAGIIVLLFNMKASSILNTFVYDKGGLICIIAISAILLLYGTRQISGLIRNRIEAKGIVSIKIINGNINLSAEGLIDTGNQIKDERGKGVIILGNDLSNTLKILPRGMPVKITTINGESVFETVIIEKLEIYYKDKSNTINSVCAALTERKFNGYQAILFAED